MDRIAESALESYGSFMAGFYQRPSIKAPFRDRETVLRAMAEAGRLTVESRLVDSFFGNISCLWENTVFISQTGSSLDELTGHIDPCPMDGSSTSAVTASSELAAHRSVYELTGWKAILHGHPKFSVIMSMLCEDKECVTRGSCHVRCQRERFAAGVPIVSGEVGTGPTGLCNTLPPAMAGSGAIVYGHGLFTTGREDFTDAFASLFEIEKTCFEEYALFQAR